MTIEFRVADAMRSPKKDVITALDIYCKTVDPGSLTDTNQIKDYIWNKKSHVDENRTMFFYLLYDKNNDVIGFSEFAYLPQNQVLVLDYLCTRQRNHLLFYNFYHMVLQEITDVLKGNGQFVRYVITELSLSQKDGKLIDIDSNYFRHLLSMENYILLKYPYYQPPLLPYEEAQEFNLAIKLVSDEKNAFTLKKAQYLSIIKELYFSHYLEWYENYQNNDTYNDLLKKLLLRIQEEIPKKASAEAIALVQCHLFEEGQCPKLTVENITIPRERKKKRKTTVMFLIWTLLSIGTFILCVFPAFSNVSAVFCSFFTIIAGIITIISFRKDL